MNTKYESTIVDAHHFTFDEWLRDAMEVLGKVSGIVTAATMGGDTEGANVEMRKAAPDVEALARSFRELTKPRASTCLQRQSLADELLKIGAMLTVDKRFHDLASRLIDLSNQVKESGVCDDRAPESPF